MRNRTVFLPPFLLFALCLAALPVLARLNLKYVNRPDLETLRSGNPWGEFPGKGNLGEQKRQASSAYNFYTNITAEYWVNGTAVPDVSFDIGESYAGQIALVDDPAEERKMFFWFFPMASEDPRAEKDIIIWLNGGPGCSSMNGLLQENGPFLWQSGTLRPMRNPWSWHRLAHVVYIDQPIGTGFSTGPITARDEEDVAAQFLLFWRRFVDTFELWGSRVYVTGESYAGLYCPYIASAMLDQQFDPQEQQPGPYFDVRGMLIYDPVIAPLDVQTNIPAVAFVDYWRGLHPFNESFTALIHETAAACGFASYMDTFLTYPPPGPQPAMSAARSPDDDSPCGRLWNSILDASVRLNPCWDVYHVSATCPPLWDVIGYPYVTPGASVYFNRTDVQKAIHAPDLGRPWQVCSAVEVFVGGKDRSPPSAVYALPGVAERTGNVMIVHGSLDYVLIANGTLLGIQNMTWSGKRGFQSRPDEPFYVPYHGDELDWLIGGQERASMAGAGVVGTAHTERGLTYVGVGLAGHMGPQYAPAAALRMVEVLLGKIPSLQSRVPFLLSGLGLGEDSTDSLGNGTAPQGWSEQGNGSLRIG